MELVWEVQGRPEARPLPPSPVRQGRSQRQERPAQACTVTRDPVLVSSVGWAPQHSGRAGTSAGLLVICVGDLVTHMGEG